MTSIPVRLFYLLLVLCIQMPVGSMSHGDEYRPWIAERSNEGERAISRFRIPQGYRLELVAAEPDLANPVSFCIDEQGRFFVCETFRQDRGVVDNRGHMNWLERDLSLQTVEERVQMFRDFLGDRVENFTREHDRIRLLEDTTGDGRVDRSSVFADGFNAIEDGTGAGILAYRGDVYFTCIPHLWRLRDLTGNGVADERESLASGFGVRVAFRGHDLHGLTWGPDGRLYFSLGDRGYNVETREGRQLVQPETGAVFRCEPDGSHLEVFATGLRNPQEIAFDEFGHLFTCDNNSDSGDQCKWYHILEGSDHGWRMYFQYLNDRGPWNRERMWQPYRADELTTELQPAFINPPRANISDGPSGLVYYPGIGLEERYRGHFFLVDFRGSAGNSGIRSFTLEPNGATFDLVGAHEFLWSMLATDVDFGWDGSMYFLDWVDGWTGPGKGRIYRLVHEATEHDPVRSQTARLISQGLDDLPAGELIELFRHPDRRVRLEAQFTLARRAGDGDIQTLLAAATDRNTDLLVRLHALWGLGQLARRESLSAATIAGFLMDEVAELQAQAATLVGDLQVRSATPDLIRLLEGSDSPRVQYAAALALGKVGDGSATPALIRLLERNQDLDPALRHAGIMGITRCMLAEELAELSRHASRSVRLAAVVALRRQADPEVVVFLDDAEPQVVDEAARAIHDLPIATALPILADLANRPGMSDALARRVMNANFRLGGADRAHKIAQMAAAGETPEHLRIEAIHELLVWGEPPVLDRVTNEFRPMPARPREEAESAVRVSLAGILTGPQAVRQEGVRLAAAYGIEEIGPLLAGFVRDHEQPASVRAASLAGLASLESGLFQELLQQSLEDHEPGVRAVALTLLSQRSPDQAVPRMRSVLEQATFLERQSVIQSLAEMQRADADQLLLHWLRRVVDGTAPTEIHLDLLLAAERRGTPELLEERDRYEAARPADVPLAPWQECLSGGDADRGREIFFGHTAASCRRCHVVDGSGGHVGPDLSSIGREKTVEYLLESIVLPNARIAKGFESVLLALDDGRVISGIVRGEDEHVYRLVVGTGDVIFVEKSRIEEQAEGRSGMPDDIWKQLTRSEIRDLVAYLATLQAPPPTGSEEP